MRILLDTHTFLWFVEDSLKLSPDAKTIIEDPRNQRCMSIASFWEIAIKVGPKKLDLGEALSTFLPHQIAFNSIKVLPVQLDHILAVSTLPLHHRDPFDRMIVAAAMVDGVEIVSADQTLDAYPIKRHWQPSHGGRFSIQSSPMSEQKSWQARISEATDAVAAKFVESISYDRRIYKQDIAGSIAHATMLEKVGLITGAEREAIVVGLKDIEKDIEAGDFVFDESLEDIHMVVEDALIKRIGEPGKKLHTGRSRNDQVALDLIMWIYGNWPNEGINSLIRSFVDCAERNAEVVMPSFTHLQRAQPISAGAECLAWAQAFDRCASRCWRLGEMHEASPLGSGAIAGSSLPIERMLAVDCLTTTPRIVGLDGYLNSIEATASRDAALDFVYTLSTIAMWLSRWAEQWIIYMTTEFGFIKIADRYTTSSSMMPQKRNPDMLELIRGRCGNVYGDLFALMTILKGLPIGYNRDLQEDKRIVFRAYDTVSSCLTMAAAIVNSANYDKERIEPTLDRGFLDATSLAEYLVTKGIPFRTAHHIVGTLVARCEKERKHALSQLNVEAMNEVIEQATGGASSPATRVDEEVYTCLGAKNVVKRYQSAGAAGGKPFEDQLAAWKARLGL